MAYKGNQIDKENLNQDLKDEIDKIEIVKNEVDVIKPKVNNSWQKGVFNDTDITNLSNINSSRVFYITGWKAPASNIEQVSIVIPVANFNGVVKVSVTGNYNNTDAFGAFEYVTHYAKLGDTLFSHQRTILKADKRIATEYYFLDFNFSGGLFTIPIVRKPNAINNLTVKVEFLTTQDGTFNMLKDAVLVFEDFGTSWHGYPWTPQASQIPTYDAIYRWDRKSDSIAFDKGGSGGYPDPNTFLDSTFITNHANAQSPNRPVDFWYIEQVFYGGNGLTNNRSQFARSYYNSQADMKVRHYFDGSWSAWSPSIQEVFQSVSNGKAQVASAITGKGVQTASDATFETMAANIRAISAGVTGSFNLPALNPYTSTDITLGPFNFLVKQYCSDIAGVQMCNGMQAQTPNEPSVKGDFIHPIIGNGNGTYSLKITFRNQTSGNSPLRLVNYFVAP